MNEMVFRVQDKVYKEHPAQCLVQVRVQVIEGKLMARTINETMPEDSPPLPESLPFVDRVT